MSLEGSLASFGLPDVLSLLAMTNKTGHLRLRREDGEVHGTVVLRDGAVVAAASDDSDNTLARRFIAAGLIDHAALSSSLAGTEDLAESLAGAADLSAQTIEDLAKEQVLDAVFDLLRWEDGDFGFDVCTVAPARTHTDVAATVVVAEAQRRLVSLQELTDRLPDPSTVLALPLMAADDRPVEPEQWAAMALVDGRRTLAEAVALSDHGAWQTLTVFAGLIERGLLVEASDQRSAVYRSSLMSLLGGSVPLPPAEPVTAGTQEDSGPMPVEAPITVGPVLLEPTGPDFAAAPDFAVAPDFAAAPELPAASEPMAEPVVAMVAPEPADDGIDDALLQQLMAGARAL